MFVYVKKKNTEQAPICALVELKICYIIAILSTVHLTEDYLPCKIAQKAPAGWDVISLSSMTKWCFWCNYHCPPLGDRCNSGLKTLVSSFFTYLYKYTSDSAVGLRTTSIAFPPLSDVIIKLIIKGSPIYMVTIILVQYGSKVILTKHNSWSEDKQNNQHKRDGI